MPLVWSDRALQVIGERWTLLIVRDAFYGVHRFNDFRANLDILKAVLSERLNGLSEDGILQRLRDPGHAGRNLYQLTQVGRDLWPALHALLMWEPPPPGQRPAVQARRMWHRPGRQRCLPGAYRTLAGIKKTHPGLLAHWRWEAQRRSAAARTG